MTISINCLYKLYFEVFIIETPVLGVIPIIKTHNVSWIVARKIRQY